MATGRIIRPRTQEGWDLLVPGQRPRSPVQINWGHELSDGLVRVWEFANATTTDLVVSAQGSAGAMEFADGGYYHDGTNKAGFRSAQPIAELNGIQQCTVVIDVEFLSATVPNPADYLIHFSTSSISTNNSFFIRRNSVGGLECWYRTSSYKFSYFTDPGRGRHCICIPFDLKDGVAGQHLFKQIYINGVSLQPTNDASSDPVSTTAFSLASQPLNIFQEGDSSDQLAGIVYSVRLYNKKLSKAEGLAITANPYKIYQQANDTPFLYSITGGATVTLSSPTATATGPTTANVGCTVTYT